MIVDWHKMTWQEQDEFRRDKMVIDLASGDDITARLIFYVDTERGIVRRYEVDREGQPIPNADATACVVIEESRAVAIVDRPAPAFGAE